MSIVHRHVSYILAMGAATAMLCHSALAQDASADAWELEEVEVAGYRAQNTAAIAEKRNSDTIAEFLSSDDIGQQPDYNIADALRRLPGVQTEFDEDEGRFVSVRGLNPSYTLGTMNGATLATAERGNRQLNIEMIPSTMVGGAEVIQARTPNTDGNAIGGTYNLKSRSAFDHNGRPYRMANMFLGGGTSTGIPGKNHGRSSDDGVSYRGDATFSDTFGGNSQFGWLVGGNYSIKRRDQDRVGPGIPTEPNVSDSPVATNPGTAITYQGYPNTVKRWGALGKLEYMPGDHFRSAVELAWFQQNEDEIRLGHGLHTTQNSNFVRFNDFAIPKPLKLGSANFEWAPVARHKVSGQVSVSEGSFYEDSHQVEFRMFQGGAPTFDVALNDEGVPEAVNISPSFSDPDNYRFFQYAPYIDDSVDAVQEASVDWAFNRDKSPGWGFQAGVKARNSERDNSRTQTLYSGYRPGGSAQNLSLTPFLTGESWQGLYGSHDMMIIDYGAWRSFFAENQGSFFQSAADISNTIKQTVGGDWVHSEDVVAGYLLGEYRADEWAVIFGGRYEKTGTDIDGWTSPSTNVTDASELTAFSRSSSYSDFLPSVTFRWDLTDAMKVRLAYFEGVGRPNPNQMAGAETRTINSETGELTLSRGNPNLKARKGRSYDAAFEWYLPGNQGIVSASVFRKLIKDEIFTLRSDEVIDGEAVTLSQPINAVGANVTGYGINYVRNNLDFLPGELANFGFQVNANWLHGSTLYVANDAYRDLDYLPRMADFNATAALFYEAHRFRGRIGYAYVADTPTNAAANEAADRWMKASHTINLQGRYQVNDKVEIISEVRNLLAPKKVTYGKRIVGGEQYKLATDVSEFGLQYWVGAAVRF